MAFCGAGVIGRRIGRRKSFGPNFKKGGKLPKPIKKVYLCLAIALWLEFTQKFILPYPHKQFMRDPNDSQSKDHFRGPPPHHFGFVRLLFALFLLGFVCVLKKTLKAIRKYHKHAPCDVVASPVNKLQAKVQRLEQKAQMFAAKAEQARNELRQAERSQYESPCVQTYSVPMMETTGLIMPPLQANPHGQ